MEKDLNRLWEEILAEATRSLPAGTADLWLKTCIPTDLVEGSLVLDVPNVFVKEQISSRFLKDLVRICRETGKSDDIELRVGSETKKDEQGSGPESCIGRLRRIPGRRNRANLAILVVGSRTGGPTRQSCRGGDAGGGL